VTEMIQLMHR